MVLPGAEVAVKSPVRDPLAHVHAGRVRKAEVDPEPHSGVHHVVAQHPPGVVVADGAWDRSGDEGQLQVPRVERVRERG